jgi:iron complex outermembrane receptor protein
LKSHWFDSRIQANAAIFYTKNDDLQVAQFPPEVTSPSVGTVVVNAGKAEIKGGELELVARPVPELDLYLNYAYLDPEYDEYIVGQDLDGSSIDTANGREFIQSPKHTLGGGIKYHFGEFSFGVLSARLDAYWQDDILFSGTPAIVAENPLIAADSAKDRAVNQQDDYMLLDARIILDQIPLADTGNFRLALWGKNLTDKEYRYTAVDLIDQLGFAISHYGEPRTYGISLTYELR